MTDTFHNKLVLKQAELIGLKSRHFISFNLIDSSYPFNRDPVRRVFQQASWKLNTFHLGSSDV